jgi:Ca2+-binding RTX toxin-like protein
MPFELAIEVLGGEGNDTLHGMHVGAAAETLNGGPGDDVIDGYGGDDLLAGGPGDDQLTGNAGNDRLYGEDGNDLLRGDHQAEPGADLIDGGAGSDRLEDYTQADADVHPPANVSLNGVADDGRPGEGDDVRSIERMTAYASGTFVGSDGPEDWQIWSNVAPGRSVVHAMGGDDVITGGDDMEEIDGGAGNDRLEGGRNHDTIIGGPGRDIIYGDETANRCNPDFPESCVRYGNDVIDARDGEVDQIDCGAGNDTVKADPDDVVAANCETVDRGTKVEGPQRPASGRPTLAPAGKQLLRTVLRTGLKVKVRGAKAGTLKLTARQGGRVVARGQAKVGASGRATVRLRFTKAAVKRLRKARSVKLTVSGGGVKATLRLKR